MTRFAFVLVVLVLAFTAGNLTKHRAALDTTDRSSDDEIMPREPWTTSAIRGTPEPPAPFRIEPAFPSLAFTNPTSLSQIPGTDRLLVTQHNGLILSFEKDAAVSEPDLVIDLKAALRGQYERPWVNLFHLTYDPDFESNRFVYVCYVHPADDRHSRVSRFVMSADAIPTIDADSEKVIIKWLAGGHNGGCLEFGPDGYLYISTGDGSGPNPPDGLTTGQTVSDLLGAILRIDVHSTAEPYTVPADNPFVELDDAMPEIWSFGLRNPWKFAIDSRTGDLLVADNGWESWEMVHRVSRGTNSGWPIMEGRVRLRGEVAQGPTPITPPVKDHSHSESNSVIGGPIYRGSALPNLDGYFVYGDYVTGTIWALSVDDSEVEHHTLVETDLRVIAFASGSEGELWVMDYDYTGQIYRLLPSETEDLSAHFPRKLSQTGLFRSLHPLVPAVGVVEYQVVADRWLDGMSARRFVAIPGDGTIEFPLAGAEARYPNGTVLVKHIMAGDLGAERPIETQILHFENDVWHPYSFSWNNAGSDADLVPMDGMDVSVEAPSLELDSDRTWRISARSECRLCHNPGSRFVLGFVPEQLDMHVSDESGAVRQLTQFAQQRVITSDTDEILSSPIRLCDPFDGELPVDQRARSYLHANCAMCHHRGGNAIVSFFLRADQPFDELNTNKGTGVGDFGITNPRIIAPGDPYRSLLYYRMLKLGAGRMPAFGSHVVDHRAVELIDEWIRSLPVDPSVPSSSYVETDSDEARMLHDLRSPQLAPEKARTSIEALLQSTEGALALVTLLHTEKLEADIAAEAIETGRRSSNPDIRGLIEAFVPESERRRTLGPRPDPAVILALTGDPGRGELIYTSDGARCRNCHHVSDAQQSLGPTIEQMVRKFPGRVELLRQILEPARRIDDNFATFTVVTIEGKVITGLKLREDDSAIQLKTAERESVTIPQDEIEDMARSDQSLMPEQLMSDLTAQEAADLLSFLRSH